MASADDAEEGRGLLASAGAPSAVVIAPSASFSRGGDRGSACSVSLTAVTDDASSSGFVSQFSLEQEEDDAAGFDDAGSRVHLHRVGPSSDGDDERRRQHLRYVELLRRARHEDLSQLEETECLYRAPCRDRLGREVVVLIGKWFKPGRVDLEKALLYLIKVLDAAVEGHYVVVYFHTRTAKDNVPQLWWVREAYAALAYKYKKNLRAFYVVHPTVWSRMACWWMATFVTPAVKNKIRNLHSLKELEAVVDVKALAVPMFITEQDMVFNGLRFYQP